MESATIRKIGDSFFVKLPSEMSDANNFIVTAVEDTLILTPKDSKWASFMESLDMFTDDIFEDWEEEKI